MTNKTILVVEDSTRLRAFIADNLEAAGYSVIGAESGKEAYSALRDSCVDLVLLDLNLGDVNGLEILKTIRRQDENLPVIIVSSVTASGAKVNGFDTGCDDYITKPFYVDELLARVRRLLKKSNADERAAPAIVEVLKSGPFEINTVSMEIRKNGKPIELRKKLFDLFLFFIRNPDTVLTNEVLFARAWNDEDGVNDNSLYVHIRQLRLLLEDDPSRPHYIQTVRHSGYRYSADPSNST